MSQEPDSFMPRMRAAQQQASDWPEPDADALEHSARLVAEIRQAMQAHQGAISFAEYMQLALYAPGLGYYSAGSQKFGTAGDFVTAPEISPLFSWSLANAIAPVLSGLAINQKSGDQNTGDQNARHWNSGHVLEVGAGRGVMAADILQRLMALECLPEKYFILELSADLRERQQQTITQRIPEALQRVEWLDELPASFTGVILANELLDAMPVQRFSIGQGSALEKYHEQYVVEDEGRFIRQSLAANERLLERIRLIESELKYEFIPGYTSEVNFHAEDWLTSIAQILQSGLVLLIDYGYPRHEFYHAQRNQGTLMCHYRHRAHDDPFIYPGLQDITSHVDFTAIADAALAADLSVAGYTTQAHFLLENGLSEMLAASEQNDAGLQLKLATQIKKLTLPQEMGELFKVMALTRKLDLPLRGFTMRDMRDYL